MAAFHSLEAIGAYLGAHARRRQVEEAERRAARAPRYVTISRQAGAGGTSVAEALAGILNEGSGGVPWTVFDRELVAEVVREHDLPGEVAKYLTEDAVPEIQTIFTELFGGVTARRGLAAKTSRTILHLAQMGNAILVGRAAAIVTAKLAGGLHVRLVGSAKARTRRLSEITGLPEDRARELMYRRDRGRREYLRKYFGADIDDPLHYHLVLNTDRMGYERAARVIAGAMEW